MSEQVLITIITGGQAVILGLIGLIASRLSSVKKDAAEAKRTSALAAADSAASKAQVQNGHTKTVLRDDIDDITGMIRTVMDRQARHGEALKDATGAVIGIRKDLRHLREVDLDHGRDIRALSTKLDDHLAWSHDYVEQQEG